MRRVKVSLRVRLDLKLLLCVDNDPRDVDTKMDGIVCALENDGAEIFSVLFELRELLLQLESDLWVRQDLPSSGLAECLGNDLLMDLSRLLDRQEVAALVESVVVHLFQLDLEILDILACHAIFAVEELNHLLLRSAHGAVILDHHVLQGLDQTALYVARLGSLDGCIDETLTTTHGVEEELLRRESAQVAVLNEALALWAEVVL